MSTIKDIHLPFRDALLQASFRGAPFFCEANSKDTGRRLVVHEFPKKDIPYAEDMGRRAKGFTIRAYCITYPLTLDGDKGQLYNIDYRVPRDALIIALEARGPGTLVLPTLPREQVCCTRYRLTEEDRFGGFCVFDIEFVEYGLPPQFLVPSENANNALANAGDTLMDQASRGLTGPTPIPGMPALPPTMAGPG